MKKFLILILLVLGFTTLSNGQWIQQGIGLDWANARWISIVDSTIAYFAADYGGFGTKIFKTTDGGATWTLVYSDSGHETRGGGKMFSNGHGYAAFNNQVVKTIDGGQSWVPIFQTGAANATIRSLVFTSENVGYAFYWINATWTTAKTTNGSNWTVIYQSSTMEFNQYNSAMFLNETTGCIPGYWGHLYKTTNGGTSWTDMMLPEEVYRVFMADANVIYAVSGMLNANVYKTTDGGATWVQKTVPSSIYLMDIWFATINTGWVCAYDGKVYRTDDGGDTWVLQSTPASYLRYITFADMNNGWSLGSQGMLIHTGNGGVTLLPPTVVTDPAANITETTADLNGTVNANNSSTTVTFEYGLTTTYGTVVSATPGTVTGNTNTPVMASISGFAPNTLYHFRCVGVNVAGTTYGDDITFTTDCTYPGNASPISGPENVCEGSGGYIYSVDPIPNATGYSWTVPPGAMITSGSNITEITVLFLEGSVSGDVTVCGINSCGPGTPSSLYVTVNSVPPTPEITQVGDILYSSSQTGNQWYLNGEPIQGATGQVYVPLVTGNYFVIVTINGCSSQQSNTLYVVIVGNEDLERSVFSIFPNPNNGIFTMTLMKRLEENTSVTIYTPLGQKLSEFIVTPEDNTFSKQLDLSVYPDGLYIIRIRDQQNESILRFLISH